MAENMSPAMSLQMGLEIECLLVFHSPPDSSNLGTEQSAIHQHIAKEFNAYTESISSGERMMAERSLQASTTAEAEAEKQFKSWTVGDDISVRPDDENTTQGNSSFPNLSPLATPGRNILSLCTSAMLPSYGCRF
jgi:hypothetical protein